MHGLLALSALHLAFLHPSQAHKYARLCDKHQAIALTKYRSILASEIDMNTADALFAFASTLSLSTMARSCSPIMTEHTQAIDLDAVVELFFLTRGVKDVIHLCYQHIKSGPMAEMFEGHSYGDDVSVILPETVAQRFRDLDRMLRASHLDAEARQHCQSALTELEDIYKNLVHFGTASLIDVGQVWRWAVAVSSGFLRLVQARIPAALIIVAHFAAATAAIRTTWYTENWGMYTLNGIEMELDQQYRCWMEWPREHRARHMDVLGIKLPEDDGKRPMIGF